MSTDFDKQWSRYAESERDAIWELTRELIVRFEKQDAAWEDIVLQLSLIIMARRLRMLDRND